jgi:hypothetical protein
MTRVEVVMRRRFTSLDELAVVLSHQLGEIVAVVPPATRVDMVAFDVDIEAPNTATALLGAYAEGTLEGNLRAFSEARARLSRLVKDARAGGGDARGSNRP